MNIQFLGAAREVTGSKHLLTLNNGTKILLDCGMFQGKGLETDKMNRQLGFNPAKIDYLVLSHAHIDHSGLIPYVYKHGFRGCIVSTSATRDLCSLMLADSAHIQESDTRDFNRKRARQGLPPVESLYSAEDAAACMNRFITIPYEFSYQLCPNVKVSFYDTGHLLGSAAVHLTVNENGKETTILFTGDIGRYDKLILRQPRPCPQADYILCESTYGDRLHSAMDDAEQKLSEIVVDTCIKKKGRLIIPAFAIGRCQEIVYSLDRLESSGRLPDIDVFVDSPLSVSATNIFRLHPECFNDDIKKYMMTDPDPFGFNKLHYTQSKEESKRINDFRKPCVIISASGMMEAGRVKHHIMHNISNSRNTLLAVGYCAPSTLGAKILRGDRQISIYGVRYDVNADIRRIDSYSAHADYKEMLHYLSSQNPEAVKKIFLVHGEISTQESYRQRLVEAGFDNVEIPAPGNRFEL